MASGDEKYTGKDYELGVNKDFEESAGRFRNVGQLFMFAIVLAGLGGFLGFGVWTKKTEKISEGMKLEYECMLRARRETPLRLYVRGSRDSALVVLVHHAYFEKVNFRSILPEPSFMANGPEGILFHFKNYPLGEGFITFNTYPSLPGNVQLRFRVNSEQIMVNQFIFP